MSLDKFTLNSINNSLLKFMKLEQYPLNIVHTNGGLSSDGYEYIGLFIGERTYSVNAKLIKALAEFDLHCPYIKNSNMRIQLNLKHIKNYNDYISVLIHEMIHAQQFYRGDLLMCSNEVFYKNTRYTNINDNYYKMPWEIEAYTETPKLYNKFVTEFNLKNIDTPLFNSRYTVKVPIEITTN